MSNTALGDIVSCLWRDAHGSVKEEFSAEDILNATSYKFTTFGILVRDDRGSEKKDPLVSLAAEVGDDGRYRGVTHIPAEMVVEVKRVKSNQPRQRTQKQPVTT